MDNIKYSEALTQLESIATRLEEGEIDIDTLSQEIKRANALIKLCRDRLEKTDEELRAIMSDTPQE